MSGNINNFQNCNVNFGNVTGDQMSSGQRNVDQTNGGQLDSSQIVEGNMNGDQINSVQMKGVLLNSSHSSADRMDGSKCFTGRTNAGFIPRGGTNAGQNLLGRSDAGPDLVRRTNTGQSPGGGTNGGLFPEGGTNAGRNLVGRMDAGPNLVGGMNTGPSPGGGTNGGLCPEGGTNAGPSTGGGTNAGQMIIARNLRIEHSENKKCWVWVNDQSEAGFTEVAELLQVKSFSIKTRKNFVELLANTKYGAYLIFKTKRDSKCLGGMQATISIGLRKGYPRSVSLKPLPHLMPPYVAMPVERSDGWMELKLGQFKCDEPIVDKYVVISIEDTNTNNKKTGLIIAGIEIRSIETAKDASDSIIGCLVFVILLLFFLYR